MPIRLPSPAFARRAIALAVAGAVAVSLGIAAPASAEVPHRPTSGLFDSCPAKWPVPVDKSKITLVLNPTPPLGSLFLCRSEFLHRKVLVNTTDAAWTVTTDSKFAIRPVSKTGRTAIFRAALQNQGYDTKSIIAPHETVRIPFFTTIVVAGAQLPMTSKASVILGLTEEFGTAATKKLVSSKSPTGKMIISCAEIASTALDAFSFDSSTTSDEVLDAAFHLSTGVGECQDAWDARALRPVPGEPKIPTWSVFVEDLAHSKAVAGLGRALTWIRP